MRASSSISFACFLILHIHRCHHHYITIQGKETAKKRLPLRHCSPVVPLHQELTLSSPIEYRALLGADTKPLQMRDDGSTCTYVLSQRAYAYVCPHSLLAERERGRESGREQRWPLTLSLCVTALRWA